MLPVRALICTLSVGLILLVAGCGGGSDSSTSTSTTGAVAGVGGAAGASGASGASGAGGSQIVHGQVTVTFQPPKTRQDAFGATLLKKGQIPQIAQTLAQTFELPVRLTVKGVNGLGGGPFYNPKDHSITLPYGFVALVFGTLKQDNPNWSGTQLGFALGAVDAFLLEHEFGHALIDVYNIPILGKEEDAADSIAAVLLLQSPQGDRLAFSAAEFWAAFSQRQSPPAIADYADEHSLDLQRADEIACQIAGSSPQRMQEVRGLHILPPSRLARCPQEYKQKVLSLKQVLDPHLKQPLNLGSP